MGRLWAPVGRRMFGTERKRAGVTCVRLLALALAAGCAQGVGLGRRRADAARGQRWAGCRGGRVRARGTGGISAGSRRARRRSAGRQRQRCAVHGRGLQPRTPRTTAPAPTAARASRCAWPTRPRPPGAPTGLWRMRGSSRWRTRARPAAAAAGRRHGRHERPRRAAAARASAGSRHRGPGSAGQRLGGTRVGRAAARAAGSGTAGTGVRRQRLGRRMRSRLRLPRPGRALLRLLQSRRVRPPTAARAATRSEMRRALEQRWPGQQHPGRAFRVASPRRGWCDQK